MVARLGRAGAAATLLAALAVGSPSPAADEPEAWSYSVWRELMSPFCPGRTLSDCPSQQAENLRMWILVQEAAGRSRADVEAELLERFGDAILAAPRAQGIGLTAYAIPLAAFLGGGVLVALALRRLTRRAGPGAEPRSPAAQPLDPELARVVDEELERSP